MEESRLKKGRLERGRLEKCRLEKGRLERGRWLEVRLQKGYQQSNQMSVCFSVWIGIGGDVGAASALKRPFSLGSRQPFEWFFWFFLEAL